MDSGLLFALLFMLPVVNSAGLGSIITTPYASVAVMPNEGDESRSLNNVPGTAAPSTYVESSTAG
ncbi:hypothetical protein BV25DRAFT_1821612 [Artomyces pyxidatus]|uniref:Uncharacterized protein n=1 Tax=Artomyces pyxidatus TaxID=48021 RepID=A0ACB8TAS7_9AGAM|nr:hypothetical protein BV25DRAFT_1821612 [Artomyces pyxidatus]